MEEGEGERANGEIMELGGGLKRKGISGRVTEEPIML